jgi:hypothetical protein
MSNTYRYRAIYFLIFDSAYKIGVTNLPTGVGRSSVMDTHVGCHLACPPFSLHPHLCSTTEVHPPLHARATIYSLA